MKIQLQPQEDLEIITKGGGKVIVPNNTDLSTDKTLATVDQIQPGGGDKADSEAIAPDFDPTHEYTLFEPCTHDGRLYLRIGEPVTGGDGSWIHEKWYEINLVDLLQTMRPSVNYSFNDIEPSSYTVEVEDRCINRIWYYSTPGQNVTISPNLTDDGSVTDFYCKFDIGSSSPFNISISNGTVSIGSNNMNGVADGDMLHFIELYREGSSTNWMVIKYRGSNGISIPIDSQLDANSTNPVENRAIYAAIGDINSVLDAINGEVI